MENKQNIINVIKNQSLVPLFYYHDKETSLSIVKSLYESGIRLIEWTNRGENALETFNYLKNNIAASMPGLYLGAGTIKTESQASDYIAAGADFIISPSIIEKVGQLAQASNVLWIPGCMTPTEIVKAENAGASLIKIFPANVVGPGFISSIKDLFPDLMFIPTGGIQADKNHLKQWFDAGVSAVGMGSTLIRKIIIQEKNYSALTNDTKLVLRHIKEIKNNE